MSEPTQKIAALRTERRELKSLKPHPKNPRDHPQPGSAKWKVLEKSLAHDYFDPIVVNERNGLLVSGHLRVKVLMHLGYELADCSIVDYDEATHEARLLAGNEQIGKNNDDKLTALIADLRASTVDPVLALMKKLPPAPMEKGGSEDAEPERGDIEGLNVKWSVKPGDVWQIGKHRLMCGSSVESADVARLLNGATPRLLITDPPYGVEYDASWRNEISSCDRAVGVVQNDDLADWSKAWSLSPAEVCYIWHASLKTVDVHSSVVGADFDPRYLIVWNKNNFAISRGDYHWKHELCWYAVRKGCSSGWIGDRKQTTVWDIDKPQKSETGHSTQKPLECMARPIRLHSGDVHEPFAGSGTTLVAAENLGRVCYAMEIHPPYCAVILDRMERCFPGIEIRRLSP